jgi:hypothetical protein
MSEIETAPEPAKPLPPLQVFFIKVGAVLGACMIFFVFAIWYVESEIQDAGLTLKQQVSGGPDFWAAVEKKLYALADERDLSEEKKARILAALRRIGQKYAPYVDALSAPAKKP